MAQQHKRLALWSPAAEQDLLGIWDYFARAAAPEVADNLLHEIKWATDRIVSVDPRMWRVRSDVMPHVRGGLRSAPIHPYIIFYRINPTPERDDIEIIRVLHQERDLPTLLSDTAHQ